MNKAAIEQFDGIRLGHFRIAPPQMVNFGAIMCKGNFLDKSYILTAPKYSFSCNGLVENGHTVNVP